MNNEKVYHVPVLKDEIIQYLNLVPGGVYIDATFGGGGHTRAILQAEPTCSVIAFDWDLNALDMNGKVLQDEFPGRLTLVWGNFAHIAKKIKDLGYTKINGILADFGTSQYQLFHGTGFSFQHDTFLDMRMSSAHQKITAKEIINKATPETLRFIFKTLGEESHTNRIVKAIIEKRLQQPITTTKQLAHLVERVVGFQGKKIHPATKIFQALRIYINKELENISIFLKASVELLADQARLVCISFHSLEDRIVKQFFKEVQSVKKGIIITPKVVTASEEELVRNSACRSAKMRVLQAVKN